MPIRKNLASSRDPYRPWGGLKGRPVCSSCGSLYLRKTWHLPEKSPKKAKKTESLNRVLCPACRKIRDKFSSGIVQLQGDFLVVHKGEILNRIKNEADRAAQVNPLERIILIEDFGDRVRVETTSERFAQRIGRELQRAFKGKTTYHWPKEDKQIRVEWTRVA